ncbi:hypothetical protein AAB992_28720 [Burkholderia contaminans]|uniref:hypothetical protein n=1 Tax=Burkholderia contaminans TaxID=488447 RepID=UPI0024176BFD|nr:hypothetical protein [Burkholderia contaminans]WFN15381.1 hypothetical protein LXE92_34970 [Burkholderia contaminans]
MTDPKTTVSDAPPCDDDEETVAPVPATSPCGDEEIGIEIALRTRLLELAAAVVTACARATSRSAEEAAAEVNRLVQRALGEAKAIEGQPAPSAPEIRIDVSVADDSIRMTAQAVGTAARAAGTADRFAMTSTNSTAASSRSTPRSLWRVRPLGRTRHGWKRRRSVRSPSSP